MCTDHPKFKGYPSRPLKDEDFLAADLSFDCPKSLDELVEKVMVWYNEKISVEWVPTPKMTREEVLLGLRQLGLEGV
ncbi:hypothetical protein BJ508DRAFT_415780 [Ascobolus immersus RN42]|uniref:Uncharacterized protein n=1 Tax=Ascobolus immersus RN42 TaxID=1160509 RepID=A0A3N4I695_ASCIM|nr:hypothetical protein BJ508DRAFT_415780 [Ascobolus immersus RN42]